MQLSKKGVQKRVLAVLVLSLTAPLTHAELSASRQSELRNLLKNDCGACHGLTLQGGMGPSLLAQALADKSDELLVTAILAGRKGTAMPSWQPLLNQEEAIWLVKTLRQSGKLPTK